jgi:Ni/Fe-hydrogenase subunit HybB-like protein
MAVQGLDNSNYDPLDRRAPLVIGRTDFASVTDDVVRPIFEGMPKVWYAVLGVALILLSLLGVSVGWLFWKGTGIWGINNPVGWGWAIINFVFWVGIGHAGTLISAILFLLRQKWRTGINRFAEAMTLFACCAVQFVIFHTGRPVGRHGVAYFPYPNQHGVWVNFTSPLEWDVFAVNSIYFTTSAVFWYIGLIPDFATLRDRATTTIKKTIYGTF